MTPDRTLAISERELFAAKRQTRVLEKQLSLLRAELRLLERSHAEAHRRAHFDALTGLPNRFLLLDRFQQAVAQATRMRTQLALLYLDLDGFKAVNDALGHVTGDELLKRVATRLLACIRASDTASRQGGDEFVILLTEVANDEGALLAAQKIRAQLALPYVIGGSAIQITASIGVAVYPIDGREHSELLQRSDFAMFRNKGAMSNRPSIVRLDQSSVSDPSSSNGDSKRAGEKMAPRRGSPAGSSSTTKTP